MIFDDIDNILSKKWYPSGFKKHDKIYPFTTENIKSYMNENLEEKNILTINGSGDQYLNAILKGANTIDTFDINLFTKYYLELKKVFIEEYSYQQFIKFFFQKNNKNELIYLESIMTKLSDEAYKFWIYIIMSSQLQIQKEGLMKNPIFYGHQTLEKSQKLNSYLNEENYNKLKNNLKNHKISFIQSDFYDIEKHITKKYDRIYLSNICLYQRNLTIFKEQILRLKEYLNPNGVIYYAYYYGNESLEINTYFKDIPGTKMTSVPGALHQNRDYILSLRKL